MEEMSRNFCRSLDAACVFPFSHGGRNHSACVEEEGEPAWCATRVDEAGKMVEGFWGECDADTCSEGETKFKNLPSYRYYFRWN